MTKRLGTHPAVIEQNDRLLCSINERIGRLVGDKSGGEDVKPLDMRSIVEDLTLVLQLEAHQIETIEDEIEREVDRQKMARSANRWQGRESM